jgi:indole-3-glycerol phosphate synthase/phosphoribosylanthranilate isomerase
MDLLSKIIASKRLRLEAAKSAVLMERVREDAIEMRRSARPHALLEVLSNADRVNIIAEFKRRSPSKGWIRENADAASTARSYQACGAAGISVLTEEDHFGGSLDDLRTVREAVSLPILRKDFIVDEYQVYESAAAGADALLLIVAALDDESLARLLSLTERELGLDALVEVHTKEELDRAVANGAKLIGVNNRDLRTFEVSTETSVNLAQFAPPETVLVSESGLTPIEVRKLKAVGYKGFLVGEALMRAVDLESELRAFRAEYMVIVKVCGITNVDDALAAVDAGADALGFNFCPRSPRYIDPKAARAIMDRLPTYVLTVGVFVNEELDAVRTIASITAGVSSLQLHGKESPEYCKALDGYHRIKVFAAGPKFNPWSVRDYDVESIMLDALDEGGIGGGTGRLSNWSVALETRKLFPTLFLAGGLSAANVGEAIKLVTPYGVDACSLLEYAPGRKDHERMRAFVAAARKATSGKRAKDLL